MALSDLKRVDIRYCTDNGSYTRGKAYFEQGRVKSLHVKNIKTDQILLISTVTGSSAMPYQQEITITEMGDNENDIDIDGYCTCPVEFNCKHVVAASLAYLANSRDVKTDTTDINPTDPYCFSWLAQFIHANHDESSGNNATDFLVYLLRPVTNSNALALQFHLTRPLKKGGLSKGRRISLDTLIDRYSSPACLQRIDHEIVKLIFAQNPHLWGRDTYEFAGDLGFLSLNKILTTGRCFWQNTGGICFRTGEPRDLQLNWQKNNNNEYQLKMNIEPQAKALNTDPALYLDIEAGYIGPLKNADYNHDQWSLLLSAPTVPAKVATQFGSQLITKAPNTQLPTPVKMETVEINSESAVPCLLLFGDLLPDGQRLHMMALTFKYGNYECKPLPVSPYLSTIEDSRIIRIQRDIDGEKVALNRLLAQDFVIIPDEFEHNLFLVSPENVDLNQSLLQWQQLMETTLPQLESEGWHIRFDSTFKLQFLQADQWNAEIESDTTNQWFELRFDLEVQGKKLQLLPLVADILSIYDPDDLPQILTIPLGNSQYLQLPSQRIRPICQTLYELYNAENINSNGGLNLNRFDAARLAELEDDCAPDAAGKSIRWFGGKAIRSLGRKLKEFQGIETVATPRGLKTELRPYQQQGLNWLQFLRKYEFNGILADDMGLGKTVQTLAHLLKEKQARRMNKPCLIIAPTSLMGNWRREAQQFTPKLKILILQGPQRQQFFDQIEQHDLILSTYPLLVRDEEVLLGHNYHTLILDEAQMIKNPRSKAAKIVRRINSKHRLCITGTPMENHLGELWAQFDFLMPGFLGSEKSFKQLFRNPIENHGDKERRDILVRRITPFMLRRSKKEVIKELPEKTEIIRSVPLDSKQAALYESIRLSMEKRVRDAIAKKGLARSHITVLDALLKLRQTCCDPQLLPLEQAKKVKQSAKLEMLMEMLPELLEEGRRILLFSQFTKMLAIIEQKLDQAGIAFLKLTGKTQKRDKVIDAFREGQADVFLISLKAGGVGLNLTEADTVIHYDPWWNPAAQNQATDRAHRIGQNKAVFVYKLITENTVEEKIISMQEQKQSLADGIYDNEGTDFKLSGDDLQALFEPLI